MPQHCCDCVRPTDRVGPVESPSSQKGSTPINRGVVITVDRLVRPPVPQPHAGGKRPLVCRIPLYEDSVWMSTF